VTDIAAIAEFEVSAKRRFGRVSHAMDYAGLGRTTLYTMATKNKGLFRKLGKITLVDFDILDRILDDTPVADINVGTTADADTS
jgi:hypothetical protein